MDAITIALLYPHRLCYKTTAVYYAASTTLYHIAYRVENYTTKCLDLLIITIYCPASRYVDECIVNNIYSFVHIVQLATNKLTPLIIQLCHILL